MASQFKKLTPLFNRVLIQKFEPVTKTASGIILQDDAKTVVGKVVEVGPGQLDNNGKLIPIAVKVGDTVLLPDFGGSKVKLSSEEYYIYRDTDLIGIVHQ